MAENGIIKALLKHTNDPGPWSKVLRPLRWLIRLLMSFTVLSLYAKAPSLIVIILGSFSGVAMTAYLFTYFYLIFKDRDSLI